VIVRLEDERARPIGDAVLDIGSPLKRLIEAVRHDDSFRLLTFVDPYQNTIFNQWQMPTLLRDLSRLKERATTDEERQLIDAVIALAQECSRQVHTYVRFRGD